MMRKLLKKYLLMNQKYQLQHLGKKIQPYSMIYILKNQSNKQIYLIEMKVYENNDKVSCVDFNIFKSLCSTIINDTEFEMDENINSISFLFYDMFDNNKYYHRLIIREGKDIENANKNNENVDDKNYNK